MKEKLSAKNYIGYTICDTANNLAFCVMGTYLAAYCTDILGITGAVVTAIFWIARIWDAINDPMMGTSPVRAENTVRLSSGRAFRLLCRLCWPIHILPTISPLTPSMLPQPTFCTA